MKKVMTGILLILLAAGMAGCGGSDTPDTSATPSASVTAQVSEEPAPLNTEGAILDEYGEPAVEGVVETMTEDTIAVRVKGETWSFELGEKAKSDIAVFNKKEKKVDVGKVIIVKYDQDGDRKIANAIEVVTSN